MSAVVQNTSNALLEGSFTLQLHPTKTALADHSVLKAGVPGLDFLVDPSTSEVTVKAGKAIVGTVEEPYSSIIRDCADMDITVNAVLIKYRKVARVKAWFTIESQLPATSDHETAVMLQALVNDKQEGLNNTFSPR